MSTRQRLDDVPLLPLLKPLPLCFCCSIIFISFSLFLPPTPALPSLLHSASLCVCPVKRNLALNGNRGSGDHAGLWQQDLFLSSLSLQQSSASAVPTVPGWDAVDGSYSGRKLMVSKTGALRTERGCDSNCSLILMQSRVCLHGEPIDT